MSQMKTVLIELKKGDYDKYTEKSLFIQALMVDFCISHTLARYIQIAHFHYLELD